MIALSIATGALGVAQTWLSNVVGQRVMHDLRAAVYEHLQRLSLAFFTRTRTGEVQSRIANDIGGVQSVVTTTATSIASNVTTVIAVIVAMVLLDWRLAVFSLALLPFFIWLTRRVGNERKRIAAERQGSLADISSLVEESLSVSGILLGKTMGRGAGAGPALHRPSPSASPTSRSARGWPDAGGWRRCRSRSPSCRRSSTGPPASGRRAVSIGTLVAFTTLQTRMFFPMQSLLSVGVDIQTSQALFVRIFEYLDMPVDITEADHPVELDPDSVRGEVAFDHVSFAYAPDAPPTLDDISLTVAPGTTTAIVGETGAGKTTAGYLVARLYDATAGAVTIDGVDVRDLSFDSLAATVGLVSPGHLSVPRLDRRQPALRAPRRDRRRARATPPAPRASTT